MPNNIVLVYLFKELGIVEIINLFLGNKSALRWGNSNFECFYCGCPLDEWKQTCDYPYMCRIYFEKYNIIYEFIIELLDIYLKSRGFYESFYYIKTDDTFYRRETEYVLHNKSFDDVDDYCLRIANNIAGDDDMKCDIEFNLLKQFCCQLWQPI